MPGISTHSLPANTQFLEFQRSDGDQRSWPTKTAKVVVDGEVNYMQPVPLDDPGSSKWREKIANGVAVKLGYPTGHYCLKDWPAGYALYIHYKGKEKSPRTDPYLYGWKSRFRSTQEFIPHAAWLLSDPATTSCECKYCTNKPQRKVAESMPPGVFTSSQSPGPGGFNRRPKDTERKKESLRAQLHKKPARGNKPYATIQPKPIVVSYTKSANLHKEAELVQRNQDLRAVTSRTSMKIRRWYRHGELIWCAIPKPIKGFHEKAVIQFWPGIVEGATLKTEAIPNNQSNPNQIDGIQTNSNGKAPERENDDEEGPPWAVSQHYNYRVQLLAVNRSVLSPDHLLLPYQAYIPNLELMDELASFPASKLNFDQSGLLEFDPCPTDGREPGNFDQAVAPLGLAMQVGARLSDFWSLTDEWAYEYTQPSMDPPSASTATPTPTQMNHQANVIAMDSLASAIQAASQGNSMSLSAIQPSSPSSFSQSQPWQQRPQPISTPLPAANSPQMRDFQAHANGMHPAPGKTHTRIQFQGLWWGAERIWTDDFVRLKLARYRLAPKGTPLMKPPSGPGDNAKAYLLANGQDPNDAGAGERGTFMRLDALYVVDVETEEGPKKEVRAAGMLYELADEDWKEENPNAGAGRRPGVAPSSSSLSAPPKFVPKPSPLNPHLNASLNASGSAATASTGKAHYLLPEPPSGFYFRPVLEEDQEAIVSLCLIGGRYYPKILLHPLLEDQVCQALGDNSTADPDELPAYSHLFALEGLTAGNYNCVDPTTYKSTRGKMFDDAHHRALIDLDNLKRGGMGDMDHADEDMEEEVDQLANDLSTHAMDVDNF